MIYKDKINICFYCPISPTGATQIYFSTFAKISESRFHRMWDYFILLLMYPLVRKGPEHAGRCSTEQSTPGYSGIYDV